MPGSVQVWREENVLHSSALGWRLLLQLCRYRGERREEGGGNQYQTGDIAGGRGAVVVVGNYQCNERETMERLLRTGGYYIIYKTI